ncbi:SrtB family sortase [Dorea longicatena]|jgi:sortase B|uniref:SrtB family sortase n=1 Tax=Dorea longicatena TaxID=88431 RepID=A0A414S050_9FIRM|nr:MULTISPECIES: class B sortase [Dorea]RHG06555.1 SrtB family sortase [Dorea longicatena]
MKKAAMAARVGNRILSIMAGILILLMLSYGVYSLWDTYKIYANSFADEELLKFRPTDDGEDNPTLKDLKKLNPDVKAWIQVPKTNIDYPVVQGQDDMEYINKNVYGEFELSGAIFLSCLNKDDFSDPYNLVYGHNMKNGGMFADVADFTNKEYFETHQKGKLYLTDATRKIQFFACMKVTAADAKIYHPDGYRKENLKDLLDYIQANAVQYRDVNVADENSLIALSTCSEAETNGRVVLIGKLEREVAEKQ